MLRPNSTWTPESERIDERGREREREKERVRRRERNCFDSSNPSGKVRKEVEEDVRIMAFPSALPCRITTMKGKEEGRREMS